MVDLNTALVMRQVCLVGVGDLGTQLDAYIVTASGLGISSLHH